MLVAVYRSCGTAWRSHLQDFNSGSDRPSPNVRRLQSCPGHNPRREKSSTALRRNSEIMLYEATGVGRGEDSELGFEWTVLSSNSVMGKRFSVPRNVQSGSGAYPKGTEFCLWIKAVGAWTLSFTSIQYRGQELEELCLHSPHTLSWRGQWQLYCFCLTFIHKVLKLSDTYW